MIYHVVYDPGAAFPQAAKFNSGKIKPDGTFIVKPGHVFFDVDSEDYPHPIRSVIRVKGRPDWFSYMITAPDVLTPMPQAEYDAKVAEDADVLERRRARGPNQRLIIQQQEIVNMIKAGRTEATADAWGAAAASSPANTAEAFSRLLRLQTAVTKALFSRLEDIFEPDE
jgi:hypothetical protein